MDITLYSIKHILLIKVTKLPLKKKLKMCLKKKKWYIHFIYYSIFMRPFMKALFLMQK